MKLTINIHLSIGNTHVQFLEVSGEENLSKHKSETLETFTLPVKQGEILKYKIDFTCTFTQSVDFKNQENVLNILSTEFDGYVSHFREEYEYTPDQEVDFEDNMIQCLEYRSKGYVLPELESSVYVDDSGEVISIADKLDSSS